MTDRPAFDDVSLAVLVAVQQRGALRAGELERLLASARPLGSTLEQLLERGHVQRQRGRWAISHEGRQYLDQILEEIECQLAPDDPAYVRRYRRREPSLPFAANTTWAEAICVNVRVEPDALRPLVPPPFELDLYRGSAFVSLTASRLKDFGVGRIPDALRMNFYQATYRAHVTFSDFRGHKRRGCYFVRAETNSPLMNLTANWLPEFKAHRCSTSSILIARHGERLLLTVDSQNDAAGKVVLVLDDAHALEAMPATSVFPSIQEAYDFVVDFYEAFSYDADRGEVLVLQIDRGDWNIRLLDPIDHYFGFFAHGPFPPGKTQLDSVFYFRDTPYRWLPLVKERIKRR